MAASARGELCGLAPHDEGKTISPISMNSAQPGDIAGIGRYLRFEEDDVKRGFHAFAFYEKKSGV